MASTISKNSDRIIRKYYYIPPSQGNLKTRRVDCRCSLHQQYFPSYVVQEYRLNDHMKIQRLKALKLFPFSPTLRFKKENTAHLRGCFCI
jgi:hypothetical protein